MGAREGWKCPECRRILSPDVTVCPCSGGTSGQSAVPLPPGPRIPASTTTLPGTDWGPNVTLVPAAAGTG